MPTPTPTLRQRLAKFPPFLCLALARRPKAATALTARERQEVLERAAVLASGQCQGVGVGPLQHWEYVRRKELEGATGINRRTMSRILNATAWDRVPVGQMLALLEACGIDLLDMAGAQQRLREVAGDERPFGHLECHARAAFLRRWQEWQGHGQGQPKAKAKAKGK